MNQNKIGKFIANKRKEKGLTQTELGEALGVSYKAVSKWENGKNMPDVSLFKELCNILNISLNELLTGEENPKEKATEDILIKTIKKKKNMDTLTTILITLIVVMVIAIISIIIYVVMSPDNSISSLDIEISKHKLKEEKIELADNNVYFYGIKDITFTTVNRKTSDLKTALKDETITLDNLQSFLETEAETNQNNKYTLDDGTIVYKNNKYTAVYCYNDDVYIGNPSMQEDFEGKYCGYEEEPCYFTRTYSILYLGIDDEYEYYNAMVKVFQGPYYIIRIPRDNYEIGVPYEFTFYTYNSFGENSYDSSFNNYHIKSITKVDNPDLIQKQNPACLTK